MGFLDKLLGRGKKLADQGKSAAERGFDAARDKVEDVTGHSHGEGEEHSHEPPEETPPTTGS